MREATPKQLDAKAEFVRRGEIGERDVLDALDRNGAGVDAHAERDRGEDGELVRGVEAADVEGRIGLGVTEPLRLLQAVFERQPFGFHLRQDIIAGAVENAADALDAIARQRLAQGLDDGNAAADRRLEGERASRALGEFGQLDAMRRQHGLVGGDDRQAAPQGGRAPPSRATPSAPPISSTKTSMSADDAISRASAKYCAPCNGSPRSPGERAL